MATYLLLVCHSVDTFLTVETPTLTRDNDLGEILVADWTHHLDNFSPSRGMYVEKIELHCELR